MLIDIKDCDFILIQRLTKVFAITTSQKKVSIKDMFIHLDKDNSGCLDSKEFINELKSLGE